VPTRTLRDKRRRAILNSDAIAEALGTTPSSTVRIPTGHLELQPLHATRCVRDGHVIFSLDEVSAAYARNAQIRTIAQAKPIHCIGECYVVGVGNALPGRKPLRWADAESETILTSFSSRCRATLQGSGATRDAFLKLIRKGTCSHFAYHGTYEPLDRLASRVELSNAERLELCEFLEGSALLAMLSACQTAINDQQALPGEFIWLIQAGVPGVVGILWSVPDLSTALLVAKFYESTLRENYRSAPRHCDVDSYRSGM
jgi:CHAT domain-containing protein